MAQSSEGGRCPPPELLTDLSGEEPVTPPGEIPETRTDSERLVRKLDALCGELDALLARMGSPTGVDDPKALEEHRSRVEAAVREVKRVLDEVAGQLARIEVSVGEVPALGKLASEVAEQLRLARSTLLGLAERVETLERWLPGKLEAIERDAAAGRETMARVLATANKLDGVVTSLEGKLAALPRIEDGVKTLKWFAVAWSAIIGVAIFVFVMEVLKRSGVL